MPKLIYGTIQSLDGYIADENGDFDWSAPDPDVFDFITELDRGVGTDIYGRRLYETMKIWQDIPDDSAEGAWAAQWKAKQKIVVSTTLADVATPNTTLLRSLDAPALAELKARASTPLTIGGPTLAAGAIREGLVDEYYFLTCPVIVGGGLRALPDDARLDLELVDERSFANGVVFTRYRPR